MARVVDQQSRVTRARAQPPWGEPVDLGKSGPVRMPSVSTTCPRTPTLGSESPRGRPAVPGDSGPAPKSCGVDQQSRATHVSVRVPARLIRYLWRIGPRSECPRVRPGLPGDSGPCPRALGVVQLSRATLARLRGPAGSTSCSKTLVLGPVDPGGLTSCSVRLRPAFEGPHVRPDVLCN